MCDGGLEIVKHQLEDRLNLFFGVAGVVRKGGILDRSVKVVR